MAAPVLPSEYRLVFAPSGFNWQGQSATGLPILCERDGHVCEPVVRYFGWSLRNARCMVSSMKDEAYNLREWWAYLASRKRRWDQPEDQLLIDWRETLKTNDIASVRIARKLEVVFAFYSKLVALYPDNPDYPQLVGRDGRITTKTLFLPHSENRVVWSGAEKKGKHQRWRPTPNEDGVHKVLSYLRISAEREALGERNWLMGRCEAEVGLRREEVSRLSLDALLCGLQAESIFLPPTLNPSEITSLVAQEGNPKLHGLDAIANWKAAQEGILDELTRLEQRGRKRLYVLIKGKGDKKRMAPFPISLVKDILDIFVWTIRRQQIEDHLSAKPFYRPPSEIFLSRKTGGPLTPGAIGDAMLDAFQECKVDGSGHRLRAYFCTMLARDLWNEALVQAGYRWDQVIENMVLDRLAQAMGHSRVTTTVRYYLDQAQLEYFNLPNRSKLGHLRKVAMVTAKYQRSLSREQLDLIARIIDVIGSGAAAFEEVIAAALAHPDLVPQPNKTEEQPSQPGPEQPRLRVVGKQDGP